MRRVFKTKAFTRSIKKSGLTDQALCDAVSEMERGLIDADLGGWVVKKRVALPGRGKSGGARTLLATNRTDRWFFVYGFKKNDKANVTEQELEALKMLAKDLLAFSPDQLDEAGKAGELKEICDERADTGEEPNSGKRP